MIESLMQEAVLPDGRLHAWSDHRVTTPLALPVRTLSVTKQDQGDTVSGREIRGLGQESVVGCNAVPRRKVPVVICLLSVLAGVYHILAI